MRTVSNLLNYEWIAKKKRTKCDNECINVSEYKIRKEIVESSDRANCDRT